MARSQKTFALVDCDSFYASCEKLFRPDLKHKPVVVLSNNDGCIVARSAEVKALGLKMAVPRFKVDHLLKKHNIAVFSSNYALYADISQRVMTTLESMAPNVEIYSIDEAFLDLDNLSCETSLTKYGQKIKNTVAKNVGISVGVGIGPTKTLAKLANHAAKKYKATSGVVDLSATDRQIRLMKITPVGDVWGVGRKISQRLNNAGIETAWQLAQCDKAMIRKQFSVVLVNTIRELNGECCISLETAAPTKQQIICSRSFGKRVTELSDMQAAVSCYASRAAEKLRAERQHCRQISVFIRTSPFAKNGQDYSNSRSMQLPIAGSDSISLSRAANQLLSQIWRDGYEYAKAGVLLMDFVPENVGQADLFLSPRQDKQQAVMKVIDRLNSRSNGVIKLGREIGSSSWGMNRNHLSPAYTTHWDDLPRVR